MKLILAQPAIPRFQWELDVLLTNIRQFTDMEVVLLFTEHDFTVPQHFRKMPGCSVFTFTDYRDDKSYIPSVRPWLLWQYLTKYPEAQEETYFYIDSDIIFREWLDFATLGFDEGTIVGSDCGGYITAQYIKGCVRGEEILNNMAEICGIRPSHMELVEGIGAHIILTKPRAEFWKRTYEDSNRIWHYLEGVDTNVQKWTAEMWAQLWGWVREGYLIQTHDDLDFCMPTDPISRWDEVKILHNAGVTNQSSHELFFKGQYVNYPPFGRDFSWVNRNKCSIRYVEAVQKVLQ